MLFDVVVSFVSDSDGATMNFTVSSLMCSRRFSARSIWMKGVCSPHYVNIVRVEEHGASQISINITDNFPQSQVKKDALYRNPFS